MQNSKFKIQNSKIKSEKNVKVQNPNPENRDYVQKNKRSNLKFKI